MCIGAQGHSNLMLYVLALLSCASDLVIAFDACLSGVSGCPELRDDGMGFGDFFALPKIRRESCIPPVTGRT